MTALTGNDILIRVQRQFGDESGVQVTSEDVKRWIVDACGEATLQNENLKTSDVLIASVAEQAEYDTSAFGAVAVQSLSYRTDANQSYYALKYLSTQEFDEYINGWDGPDYGTGIPLVYTRGTIDSPSIRLFPTPDTSTGSMRLTFNPYLTYTDMGDPIPLPEYYNNYCIEYCLMKAYEMDEDWQAAGIKAEYVQSTLDANNNRETWFGRDTYPTLTVREEDRF